MQQNLTQPIIRHADERGATKLDWLDSRHTFSFGDYMNPIFMGFNTLRVINDDVVQPSKGFREHPHSDMEILTYVLHGTLAHRDSMGHEYKMSTGDVQLMSAGTGVTHSEFNPSDTEPARFLQVWILPRERGLTPNYQQQSFYNTQDANSRLTLVASPDGEANSLTVQQDMKVYLIKLITGEPTHYHVPANKDVWLHVAIGDVQINDETRLTEGDAIGLERYDGTLQLVSLDTPAEILLFEMAAQSV